MCVRESAFKILDWSPVAKPWHRAAAAAAKCGEVPLFSDVTVRLRICTAALQQETAEELHDLYSSPNTVRVIQ
jgi:hypothetical protein